MLVTRIQSAPRCAKHGFASFFCPLVLLALASACGAHAEEEAEAANGGETPTFTATPRLLSVTPPSSETCGVDANDQLSCFTLGSYATPTRLAVTPLEARVIGDVTSVSGRNQHACAALADGFVECWRAGVTSEQLGTLGAAALPDVAGLPNVVNISAGQSHSCAVTMDGDVYCWGTNSSSQLGREGVVETTLPQRVSGLDRAIVVAAGGNHTCALSVDGSVACWGDNRAHQLGTSSVETSASPIVLERTATSIDTGLSATCVVALDGSVACWGADFDSDAYTADAGTVSGVSNAVDVAVGLRHACALIDDGRVMCWGAGDRAQLGNGIEASRSDARFVPSITFAVAIGAGGDVTCARLVSGEQWCWGGFTMVQQPFPQGS